ncbi:MAG: dihydroorotase [Bacteroidales bacterium]|jgi:dihydroorotase|nr:dihydroorotase [Bacteroidales bacterium]
MPAYLLKNASLVNEEKLMRADLLIENERIVKIIEEGKSFKIPSDCTQIDFNGKYILPGVIDDQVHFRDPGLTHKGDLESESRAAVAGGVTSFMDMPNTIPNVLSQKILEDKYRDAIGRSWANYSFYMGTSNSNSDEVLKTNAENVCGIKIFLGASTGKMLVDNIETLEKIFAESKMMIAVHCEDENTIQRNLDDAKAKYGDDIPISAHPTIRSEEACYLSSSFAVNLAKKHNTRLHVLHLSTAKEMELFSNDLPLTEKSITAEVCTHHLWFSDKDYAENGTFIKWNPAIKKRSDAEALLEALLDDRIDVVATDHAPHTLTEKENIYTKATSGGPMVQHSLVLLLEMMHQGKISLDKVVEKMCHAPARLFKIRDRGFIREGFYADLAVVDLSDPWEVMNENIHYKCGWSPLVGQQFHSKVVATFVNGQLVYDKGEFISSGQGKRLLFDRY